MFPRWLVIGVVITVTLGWLANLGAHFLFDRGDPMVSWLFGLVVGTVLGFTPAQVLRHAADRMLGRAPQDPDPAQNTDEPEPDEPGRPAGPDTPTR